MKAICILSKNYGTIIFEEDPKNKITTIKASLQKLKPGKHGIHIHETGNMTNGCATLGPHYNPFGKDHGGLHSKIRHVGDLGNINADSNGNATLNIKDKLVKLSGKYSVIGRSVVIHANEDDLGEGNYSDSKTTGHSGKRITCGIIGIL